MTKNNDLLENRLMYNIPWPLFIIFTLFAAIIIYSDNLPQGLIGALLIMIIIGEIFGKLGDNLPIIRTFLGGGAILIIFGSSFLVYGGLIPQSAIDVVDTFMADGGFLNFYIAALITGSILGMESKLLIRAGVRYFFPLVGGVLFSIVFAGVIGAIVQFGWSEAISLIALPIMGGGLGAGAVPMSQIYSDMLGNDPGYYISILVPALALGNVFAIILAALLNSLGKKFPKLTGDGQLMPGFKFEKESKGQLSVNAMGAGLLMAISFYIFGQILGMVIPLHPYALMILAVALCKIFSLLPSKVEEAANQWYQFVVTNWTYPLLVGVGITYTDLSAVMEALTLEYILIVGAVILGAAVGAALLGKLVGFYPIESAITAGLCMANMGGTGDVAVLSASKRMELMPFAQIASRLGGALILVIAGLLIPLIM